MDFVERIFGISPDQGSGLFEVCIILALAALGGLRMLRSGRRLLRRP